MLDAILESDVRSPSWLRGALDPRAVEGDSRWSKPRSTVDDRRNPSLSSVATTATVFAVDEDASVRETLKRTLELSGWRVETFASGQAFMDRPKFLAPGCLVLEVSIGDVDSLDLQRRLAIDQPAMPVIFMARHADIPLTVQAMKAGAFEFFMKPLQDHELKAAVASAIERSRDVGRVEAELIALRARLALLTPREKDVMGLVVAGRLNKQAADDLGISEITVKAHRGSAMRKMRARSFAHLVGMAARLGLAAV